MLALTEVPKNFTIAKPHDDDQLTKYYLPILYIYILYLT